MLAQQIDLPMTAREPWRVDRLAHPQLPLYVVLDPEDAVVYLGFGQGPRSRLSDLARYAAQHRARLSVETRPDTDARVQLREYLQGQRDDFDLVVRPRGTAFQCRAWEALREIPFGEIRSYRDQALALGNPGAVRAVGAANGKNPIPIILPCHRVVGSSGDLRGFGGGLEVKRWLLQLERYRQTPAWRPVPGPPAGSVPNDQLGLFS